MKLRLAKFLTGLLLLPLCAALTLTLVRALLVLAQSPTRLPLLHAFAGVAGLALWAIIAVLLIALFMVQLRYMGYESGLVPVAHADTSADVAYASPSPRSTVTAEYCSSAQ